jgi:hypothetical protein
MENSTLAGTGGTGALTTIFGATTLTILGSDAFLIFMIGAVVEVPQSGQASLYSRSRRPHFRQNGMATVHMYFLESSLAGQPFKL